MSKQITVSDEVYRQLERESGDRSIGEVIEAKLESGRELADVTGTGIFESGTLE